MKIQTTRFGEVEVNEKSLFTFIKPILGYEDEKEFVIIEHEGNEKFKWLQSTKTPVLAFAVTVASFWGIEYSFALDDKSQTELEIETAEDIVALNIAVIPNGNPLKSTINLLAPLVLNFRTHKAAQVILSGTNFDVEHPLFKDSEVKSC